MKRFLALLSCVCITAFAFAQDNYQDVVYLKNGSIIRGIIIEQVPDQSIKIETADKNVFVYHIDEIEKITKEPYQERGNDSFNRTDTGLQPGHRGTVELGYQYGIGNYSMNRLKLNIIVNGYQFYPYFSLGLGAGLRYYYDANVCIVPIFAHFRTCFINNKISPSFSLGIGYSFDATNKFEETGFLLNPAIGINIIISNKIAYNFGLGYEMQRMKFYYGGNDSTESLGALSIVAGLLF